MLNGLAMLAVCGNYNIRVYKTKVYQKKPIGFSFFFLKRIFRKTHKYLKKYNLHSVPFKVRVDLLRGRREGAIAGENGMMRRKKKTLL